ncbi:DUF3817 domain-containing protein [Arsenicitalea aurantiaca]|uniref:DUF3817 domain-containing protein n=1 Tax=Arsenicitalea aurantiaca TaxID=1783274 RepID=A0A433XB52_9HYPH|nr:DUF3817 domain-containing protein [Arsenicitalea aurantiaca]RUT31306.1 DUF3817 domain-containing protein [Arsenicitalea aurantiaca]
MLRTFRIVALFEGLTTLALFLVAMPAKHVFGFPALVPPVGLVHGIAFLAYIAMMVAAFSGQGYAPATWARTTIASFFPFGTFLNDPHLKRLEAKAA